jgi:hypothetical protein
MHDDRLEVANPLEHENHPPGKCCHNFTSNNLRRVSHETRAESTHSHAESHNCSEANKGKQEEERPDE